MHSGTKIFSVVAILGIVALLSAALITYYPLDTTIEITNMIDEECREIAIAEGDLLCGDYMDCPNTTQNAYDECVKEKRWDPEFPECDEGECGDVFLNETDPRILGEAPGIECPPDMLSCT